MSDTRLSAVRLLGTGVALTVLLTSGCTSGARSTAPPPAVPVPTAAPAAPAPAAPAPAAPTSAAPSPARPALQQLVIDVDDIPLPGFLPPTVRPLDVDEVEGVEAYFDSADGRRRLGATIVLLPDADAARTAVQGAAETIREQRPGATVAPARAGDTAVVVTGYEQDGTASTLLLLSEGTASVVLDFRSPAADPTPADTVIEAGVRQAALLNTVYG